MLFEETRAYTEKLSDASLYANRMFQMQSAYRTEGQMARALAVNSDLMAFGQRHRQTHVIVSATGPGP